MSYIVIVHDALKKKKNNINSKILNLYRHFKSTEKEYCVALVNER